VILMLSQKHLLACFRLAAQGAKLWLDSARVSVAIKNAFDDACVQYYVDLEIARSGKRSSKEQTATDKEELDGPAALHRPSPVGIAKAIKNEAELEGMRQAHLRCHSCLLWVPVLGCSCGCPRNGFDCFSALLQGCCCTL
jgi:Xaa-Pro aminopeptidase